MSSIGEAKATHLSRKPIRVLIIDDNRDNAALLGKLLEMTDHETLILNEAPLFRDRLDDFRPDVVLLDLAMPQLTGYEIAERIRQESRFDGIPIIAISGFGGVDHQNRCQEAGIDRLFLKPVEFAELADVMHSEMRRRMSRPVDAAES